jgi:hypothetical protein
MGGVDGCDQMCTLHAVVVLCFCGWQVLANRSMRIQDLYVGTFPLFIRNISICCWGGVYIVKERLREIKGEAGEWP